MQRLRSLIDTRPANAAVSWSLVAFLGIVAVASALNGEVLWAVFTVAIVVVALLPAAVAGDRSVIVSWEALLLATAPVAVRHVGLYADPLSYVSAATLALLIAVEVETFSDARMTPWFAVLFVVMTTMTAAAVWGIAQFYADALIGTSFLDGNADLMWDLVGATAVGVGAGVVFELYFRRQGPSNRQAVPDGRDG